MPKTIYGKRGFEVSLKFIIMWIVLPIIAGLFILMIFVQVGGKASGGFGDDLCHMNAGFKNMLWTGLKVVLPLFACKERVVTVDANNWDKCDPSDALNYESNNNLRDCAQEQLFTLIERCWYMYGQGSFDFAALSNGNNCFAVTIRDLGDTAISENTLVAFMKTHLKNGKSYCAIVPDNRICTPLCSDFACGTSDRITWDGKDFKTSQRMFVDFYDVQLAANQVDKVRLYHAGDSGLVT